MTLFISLLSLFISLAMMVLTAFNYLRTWERQKFNINYEILNVYFVRDTDFYTHMRIINNSSEPIAISGISINDEFCDNKEMFITGGTDLLQPIKTTELPIFLESYGATEFYLCFHNKSKSIPVEGYDLEIRTSRSIIKDHIVHKEGLLKPITEIRNN